MKTGWLAASTAGLLALGALAPHVRAESDVNYLGAVAFGYTTLAFDAKLDSRPSFESVTLTGGIMLDDYSLNLVYSDSISHITFSEEEDVGKGGRSDIDLVLLYRATEALNLFVGYKDSATEIDFVLRDSDVLRREFYRTDGWFAGLSYNLRLRGAGSVGLSLSYVDLTSDDLFRADIEEDEPDVTEFDDLSGRHRGKADGWSYAINWLVPVSEQVFINTTYKINDYDHSIVFNGQTFRADQRLTFFNIGVVSLF